MKKIVSILLTGAVCLSFLAGCSNGGTSSSGAELKKIVIGASTTPHAVILKEAAKLLKDKGYDLQVKEFSDYVLPNTALDHKELDANYFQHQPYLDTFNQKNGTSLVSAGSIHYEPFGIYAGRTKALADLKDGASIAVPSDTSNEARALLLLQAQGIIKIKDDAGITATQKDIVENKKNIQIKEIEAAQLARVLPDVDLAVINGNYAMQGNLKVADALAVEASDSVAATTYANIIAVRKGDENREDIKALIAVLKGSEMKDFITKNFNGAVVPAK
jgi:D-methionine transport system substrate-binding protein